MESKDLSQVYALFKKQQQNYDYSVKMSQEELQHHLVCEGVVYTIVFEQSNRIIDFISFYVSKKVTPKDVPDSYGPLKVANMYYFG